MYNDDDFDEYFDDNLDPDFEDEDLDLVTTKLDTNYSENNDSCLDLLDVIGWHLADDPNYCGTNYHTWERQVATPALIDHGYAIVRWYMGDYDSFGPLTRCVEAYDSNGNLHKFIYG